MKTIIISLFALMLGTTIFSKNDSLNLMNLKFDISEEDVYQDLF